MIYKLLALTLVFGIILIYLKSYASEFFTPGLICASLIIISSLSSYFVDVLDFFDELSSIANIDRSTIKLVIKVFAISYLVEFGVSLASDMQLTSLADKLAFGGKVIIFSICLPVLKEIIDILAGLL